MSSEAAVKEAVATRRFLVVWQHPESREFVNVGDLQVNHAHGNIISCRFAYRQDVGATPGFQPFLAFPEVGGSYERDGDLFPFFQNRIMSPRRPDFDQYADALGLTHGQADPVEILARSAGARATDTVHVVPEPDTAPDGTETRLFLVSGIRHTPDVEARMKRLRPGQHLQLRAEPDNQANPRAVLLDVERGEPVGWVPNYLLDYVHKHREAGSTIDVTVVKANGPEAPAHLRLLARMVVRPEA